MSNNQQILIFFSCLLEFTIKQFFVFLPHEQLQIQIMLLIHLLCLLLNFLIKIFMVSLVQLHSNQFEYFRAMYVKVKGSN